MRKLRLDTGESRRKETIKITCTPDPLGENSGITKPKAVKALKNRRSGLVPAIPQLSLKPLSIDCFAERVQTPHYSSREKGAETLQDPPSGSAPQDQSNDVSGRGNRQSNRVDMKIRKRSVSSGGFKLSTTVSSQDIVTLGTIGRGQNGCVLMALHVPPFRLMALKEMSIYLKSSRHQLIKELKAFKQTKHKNIVQFLGAFFDQGKIVLALEYMNGGSLAQCVETNGPLAERVVRSVMLQAMRGLQILHDRFYVHSDIKPENILINFDGEAKISDFGLAREVSKTSRSILATGGTVLFLSPERIKRLAFSFPSDIWSIGITLIYICTAKMPYETQDIWGLACEIGEDISPNLDRKLFSPELCDLVDSCLKKDPKMRDTATRILNRPYLKNADIIPRTEWGLKSDGNSMKREEKTKDILHTIFRKLQEQDINGDTGDNLVPELLSDMITEQDVESLANQMGIPLSKIAEPMNNIFREQSTFSKEFYSRVRPEFSAKLVSQTEEDVSWALDEQTPMDMFDATFVDVGEERIGEEINYQNGHNDSQGSVHSEASPRTTKQKIALSVRQFDKRRNSNRHSPTKRSNESHSIKERMSHSMGEPMTNTPTKRYLRHNTAMEDRPRWPNSKTSTLEHVEPLSLTERSVSDLNEDRSGLSGWHYDHAGSPDSGSASPSRRILRTKTAMNERQMTEERRKWPNLITIDGITQSTQRSKTFDQMRGEYNGVPIRRFHAMKLSGVSGTGLHLTTRSSSGFVDGQQHALPKLIRGGRNRNPGGMPQWVDARRSGDGGGNGRWPSNVPRMGEVSQGARSKRSNVESGNMHGKTKSHSAQQPSKRLSQRGNGQREVSSSQMSRSASFALGSKVRQHRQLKSMERKKSNFSRPQSRQYSSQDFQNSNSTYVPQWSASSILRRNRERYNIQKSTSLSKLRALPKANVDKATTRYNREMIRSSSFTVRSIHPKEAKSGTGRNLRPDGTDVNPVFEIRRYSDHHLPSQRTSPSKRLAQKIRKSLNQSEPVLSTFSPGSHLNAISSNRFPINSNKVRRSHTFTRR